MSKVVLEHGIVPDTRLWPAIQKHRLVRWWKKNSHSKSRKSTSMGYGILFDPNCECDNESTQDAVRVTTPRRRFWQWINKKIRKGNSLRIFRGDGTWCSFSVQTIHSSNNNNNNNNNNKNNDHWDKGETRSSLTAIRKKLSRNGNRKKQTTEPIT